MFKVGDVVSWNSQAGGYWKVKTGTIVCVVPAGKQPPADKFERLVKTCGRSEESYVVDVSGKYYWPHASGLMEVKTEA